MCAEDNAYAPETADDDTSENRTEPVKSRIQPLNKKTYIDSDRSDHYQHNRNHDNQRQSGNQDELQNLRNNFL